MDADGIFQFATHRKLLHRRRSKNREVEGGARFRIDQPINTHTIKHLKEEQPPPLPSKATTKKE